MSEIYRKYVSGGHTIWKLISCITCQPNTARISTYTLLKSDFDLIICVLFSLAEKYWIHFLKNFDVNLTEKFFLRVCLLLKIPVELSIGKPKKGSWRGFFIQVFFRQHFHVFHYFQTLIQLARIFAFHLIQFVQILAFHLIQFVQILAFHLVLEHFLQDFVKEITICRRKYCNPYQE